MRPENTEAQALRRKNALWGAVSSTAVRVVAALVLLIRKVTIYQGFMDNPPHLDQFKDKTERN